MAGASFYLYYYTFVARLTDAQIAVWIAAVPIIGLLAKSAMAAVWGRWFAAKHRTPRSYTVAGRLLDAANHVLFFSTTTSIEGFLAAICIHNVFISPRSFWSISARGWVRTPAPLPRAPRAFARGELTLTAMRL